MSAPARLCRAVLLLLCLMLAGMPAAAFSPDERLADPVLEGRARALGSGLRCLVCRNESIDDSDADLARDLRLLVRRRLVAGDSDADVLRYMTARYGDYVLLRPPVKPATYLLWFGTPVLLAALLLLMWRSRRRTAEPAAALSQEERARLRRLLDGEAR